MEATPKKIGMWPFKSQMKSFEKHDVTIKRDIIYFFASFHCCFLSNTNNTKIKEKKFLWHTSL